MEIGTKIRILREKNRMSQIELANKLGIGQTTLGFIESGETKKIDFALIDKICKLFNVDFEYFTTNSQINNIKKLKGSVNNHGTINLISNQVLEQIKFLIEDNKEKAIEIERLNIIIKNFNT